MRSAIYFVIRNKNRIRVRQHVNEAGILMKGIWIFIVLFLQLTCELKLFGAYFS